MTRNDDGRRGPAPWSWWAIPLSALAACQASSASEPEPALEPSASIAAPPHASRPALCARPAEDAVRDVFCADAPHGITSLRDLQFRLEAHLKPPSDLPAQSLAPTDDLVDIAVVLTHSTALSGRLVSPINPRVIVVGTSTLLTFQRGVQQVEIAAVRRDRGGLNFYLVNFEQACNERPGGCLPGDLYTPRVESNWTNVTLRDDDELKNTPLDCRQCHQRGRDESVLLMRELQGPWTHFFEPEYLPENSADVPLPGVRGRDLLLDFLRAKGDETYGGIASYNLRRTAGVTLQNVVTPQQPLLFDAPGIEDERWPFGADGYPSEPRPSMIWEQAYEAFKRGEQLALPYLEPRATDPAKQARLTEAYARHRRGELAAEDLPDLADIFPDDPKLRARIGLQTEPDATPVDALIQACASCHNDVLDQTITRARFNVDLTRMSRAELDLAIERVLLPSDHPGVMPPFEARQLDPAVRARLVAYLRSPTRSVADEAALQHAAEVGMTGGGRP